ncbi:MAG: selenoneine biosynthesis selenosugar synthase SenB [Hydrogenophaga sp.]|nr:selenoneine biosynthesis selenosugar synthase SenB [Hydrogenophaga sp.]
MKLPSLCIVTPALADANNGNWQTARRWAQMLSGHYAVQLARAWPDAGPGLPDADLLLALHARRSASSIAAWAQAHPQRPLLVALTGTDLYRDIDHDASAQRSLALAHRLIVLQDQAPLALPPQWRDKCRVVLQSSTRRQTLPKSSRHLRVVAVGHLRDEKDPLTLMAAARLLRPDEGIRIDHIGAALDPALGEAARETARDCLHYRWLGALPHGVARLHIQRAHLLVHPSRMEGGAHVIMEAVCSGTPVLASHMSGNVGMLGVDYAGYFPVGDAPALAARFRQCRQDIATGGSSLALLQAQCAARAPLFEPRAEQAALLQVLHECRP